MEQRTIRLNFDLSFVYGPRTWRVPFVAAMLLCAVGDLNSESVTLSTYYPAPSGVYTNMITTGNTFLARDGGAATKVGLGTITPGAKLAVSGTMSVGAGYAATVPPADSMIVSGNIGARMAVPTQAVDVVGNVHINAAGCAVSASVANGAICGAGQYATFQAGVYTEGWSYHNLPAPFLITPSLTRIYKFVGINPADGQQSAMSFGYTEAITVACCNR
jgi:hypothetical protein